MSRGKYRCDPAPPGFRGFLPVGYPQGKQRTAPATRTVNRDMSYDASHRKPPRQERWPSATPAEGWPSYRDDGYRDGEYADRRYTADRQAARPATAGYRHETGFQGASGELEDRGYQSAVATDTFPPARNGYNSVAGYGEARNGYARTENGYARTENGYDWNENGYSSAAEGYGSAADDFAGAPDGYAWARDDFAGSAGYLDPGSYTEPGLSDPMLAAPDTGVDPHRWQADRDLRREAGRRGMVVGAVTGFLAVAVAIGVSTLIAGFVRPEASPMAALGSVFIDRTPAALRNAAIHHFGASGQTLLLLGMYAAIAVLAVGIGMLARHAAAAGVAGLAAFSLLAAFVTITRPGGRVSDVAPAIIGGIAGVAALLWLLQASAPAPPLRHARGNGRRRHDDDRL